MPTQLKLGALALAAALTATVAVPTAHAAVSAEAPVYTGRFSNLAVEGVDVVELFSGAVTKGQEQFQTTYNGAEWRFSSQENLDRFEANPTAFAPQYGGYCAWAIAQGSLAKGDPKFARVVDGKLYLNFNADIQNRWLADVPGFIQKADVNWPGLLSN